MRPCYNWLCSILIPLLILLAAGYLASGSASQISDMPGKLAPVQVTPTVPNIGGLWRMVSNLDNDFDLVIIQDRENITGTMKSTDRIEPEDPITGKIYPDGKVEFTRLHPHTFTQIYTGTIYILSDNNTLIMEGTYTHNGKGQYPWNATKNRIGGTTLSNLQIVYKRDSFGIHVPSSIDRNLIKPYTCPKYCMLALL